MAMHKINVLDRQYWQRLGILSVISHSETEIGWTCIIRGIFINTTGLNELFKSNQKNQIDQLI